jgi:hypothetical protein
MTSAEQLALESLSRHVVDTGGERCPRRLVVYLATSVLDLLDDLRERSLRAIDDDLEREEDRPP